MADKNIEEWLSGFPAITIGHTSDLPYAIEEALNRLRVNMSFFGDEIRKIMVTSTVPEEGKSFVTMQVWRQLTAANVPAVLIDADIRKSIAVDKYDLKREDGKKLRGLSEYLSGQAGLEEVLYHYGAGALIPNVDNVLNPSMLLANGRLEKLMNQLAEKFKYVIIDTPPLDTVSDGEKIGSYCDGAILCIRGGSTPKKMAMNSARQLERAGCPILGTVLTRVEGSGNGYYYKRYGSYYGSKKYGYGYGYGYGQDEKEASGEKK